jgi:gliding motility-associated-like protein
MFVIPKTYLNKVLLIISICILSYYNTIAQYEYISTLDYKALKLTRINNIPGVTKVVDDNTAYDENNQRFFFQGNATSIRPFQLFTVSATTGATIYNPFCPSNNTQGQILGLQYDNAVDTLYAIYNDNKGTVYFSWIELATGIVHPITPIPAFINYTESSFDKKNRWYICHGGPELIIIEVFSGNILFRNNFPPSINITNLVFDNSNSKLLGVCYSSLWPNPQFDSISLSTGALHFISNLPAMSLPQLNTNAVDELNQVFLFVGKDPVSSNCINNYLYQVDINSGNLLSKELYPYAQNAGSPFNENAIEFSYDSKGNKLFVLNWRPPDSTFQHSVDIAIWPAKLCSGDSATFKATPWSGAVNPSFQWQINGINAGYDTSVFIVKNPNAGDVVQCIMINHSPCANGSPDTSNSILVEFTPSEVLTVNIDASANPVCIGTKVVFNATTSLKGQFSYRWQINKQPAGIDSSVCILDSLSNKDTVNCLVSGNSGCIMPNPAISNDIVMRANSNPASVTISADKTTICQGDTVTFTASGVNEGDDPTYQWQINGNNAGQNNNTFTTANLKDADIVSCVMVSSIACSLPVVSTNQIQLTVNKIPTLKMGNDTVIAPGQKVYLHPDITESISHFTWAPLQGLDNPYTEFPTAVPEQTTTYSLTVTSASGCTATGKINIVVYRTLNMPNAFSPNSDGKNDIFRIPPLSPQQIKDFTIYNRYGQRIFSTDDNNKGWDGTFNGVPQPAGTYVWKIEYINMFTKRSMVAGGIVILVR